MLELFAECLHYHKTVLERIKHMDAVVTTLQSDVATLKTQVGALLAAIQTPSLPADDAAAIAQANSDISALNSQMAAALNPPAATGPTGVTGTAAPAA